MIYARFLDGPLAGETLRLNRYVDPDYDGTLAGDFVYQRPVRGLLTDLRYVQEGDPVYSPHDDPIVYYRLHQEAEAIDRVQTFGDVGSAANKLIDRYPANIPSDEFDLRLKVARLLFFRRIDPEEIAAILRASWKLTRALTEEVGVGFTQYERVTVLGTQQIVDWSDYHRLLGVHPARIADALGKLAAEIEA